MVQLFGFDVLTHSGRFLFESYDPQQRPILRTENAPLILSSSPFSYPVSSATPVQKYKPLPVKFSEQLGSPLQSFSFRRRRN
eukprot:g3284.t1